jgi:hypothetical protein
VAVDFSFKLDITFNLNELTRLYEIAPDVVRSEVRSTLGRIAARTEKEVVEKTPRGVGAQGGLAGSIHGEVVPYGESLAAITGTPLEQGVVVELGRRPDKRQPPTGPLELWLIRKVGLDPDEAKQAAFGLAKMIGKFGFKDGGAHMFEKTFKELDPWITGELMSIPQRVVDRINRGST